MPLDVASLVAEVESLKGAIGRGAKRQENAARTAENPGQSLEEFQAQRHRLCKVCEHLLLHNPRESAENDITRKLFQYGWHATFQNFRSRLKPLGDAQRVAHESHSVLPETQVVMLRKLTGEMRDFLGKGVAFYQRLFESLKRRIMTDELPEIQQLHRASLHNVCIVLGDLARYVEMYRDTGKKTWQEAELWYTRALELIPSDGNPHNQLAVLAAYSTDNDLLAVYRYIRALSARKPFVTAKKNLLRTYAQNRKRVNDTKLLTEKDTLQPLQHPRGKMLLRSQERRDLRRAFFARFVWVNGVLQGVGIDDRKRQRSMNPLRAMPMLLHRLIAVELPHLLHAFAFGSEALLAMIVLLVHSMDRASEAVETRIRSQLHQTVSEAGIGSEEHDDAWRLSLACSAGFGFVSALLFQASNAFQTARKAASGGNGDSNEQKKPVSLRALASLVPASIFCEWLDRRGDLLSTFDGGPDPLHEAKVGSVPEQVDVMERSARRRFWEVLAGLLNASQSMPLNDGGSAEVRPLREECRLRGFLPLDDLYEPRCCVVSGPNAAPEDMAAYCRRVLKIRKFGEWIASMGDNRGLLYLDPQGGMFSTEPPAPPPLYSRHDPSSGSSTSAPRTLFVPPPSNGTDGEEEEEEEEDHETTHFEWDEQPQPMETAALGSAAFELNRDALHTSPQLSFGQGFGMDGGVRKMDDETAASMVAMLVSSQTTHITKDSALARANVSADPGLGDGAAPVGVLPLYATPQDLVFHGAPSNAIPSETEEEEARAPFGGHRFQAHFLEYLESGAKLLCCTSSI